MSMYQCAECQRMLDGDQDPCVENPNDPTDFCCESCREEILEERETEKEYARMRSANQREVESGLKKGN